MATITVLEARNLISTDPNGLSDPYCLIGVADPQTGNFVDKKACIRSETKRWTLTPAWKKGILEVNKRPSVVRVEIWDKDEDKEDDFVGLALIKLDSVQNTEDKWITLLTKHGKENKLGDIHVIVNIHQAAQAAPAIVQQTIQKAQSVPVTAQTTAKPAATTAHQTIAKPAATTTHQTTAPTSAIPHVTGKPHPSATPHPTTTPTPTPTPIAANPVPATVPQPTTTPARPVSAIPASAQTTSTPSQSTPARPTPNTTPTPVHPTPNTTPTPAHPTPTLPTPAHPTPNTTPTPAHPIPAHPTPTQTTSRPTPAPAPTPQPASAPSRQVVTAPSAPKPAQPPANAAEIQKKNSELAQKHAKLAASYHAQGAIMEALEHYNLSSALYARAFGSGDKRAIATEQCATQLMMEISFGAFMA